MVQGPGGASQPVRGGAATDSLGAQRGSCLLFDNADLRYVLCVTTLSPFLAEPASGRCGHVTSQLLLSPALSQAAGLANQYILAR